MHITVEDVDLNLEEKMSNQQDDEIPDVEFGENDGPIVAAAFIIGGSFGAFYVPNQPVTAFFLWGTIAAGAGWVIGTKSGRQSVKQLEEQQQQQVNKGDSVEKRTCPHCGWQNPVRNNYCHDCGNIIAGNTEKSDLDDSISDLRDRYVEGEISDAEFEERVKEKIESDNE